MPLHPYRFFSTTCREAMTRYQEILGGRLDMMTFADLPPGEGGDGEIDPNLVMHAALIFDDGHMLMASDDPSGDGGPAKGVTLHVTAPSIEDGERIFGQLAEGGSVDMPFGETFWALRFGGCTDRFGTSWMVSVDHPSSSAA